MQTIRITTSQNIDIDYEIAGVGERMIATVIDYAIFGLLAILCTIVYSLSSGVGSKAVVIAYFVIYFALFVFYDLVCEIFMNGQSIGKRTMKIKVISLDGGQASVGQYMMRWIFRIVDCTLTTYACAIISVAVSKNSQRVGDMVAGTTLIRTVPRAKMDSLAFIPHTDNYEPVFTQVTQLTDKDIVLVHEVIGTFMRSGNITLLRNTASKLRQLLNITSEIDDLTLLETIIRDYNHIAAAEVAI